MIKIIQEAEVRVTCDICGRVVYLDEEIAAVKYVKFPSYKIYHLCKIHRKLFDQWINGMKQ